MDFRKYGRKALDTLHFAKRYVHQQVRNLKKNPRPLDPSLTDPGPDLNDNEIVAPQGYKLAWHDEFSGKGLPNSDDWTFITDETYMNYNNELQSYTANTENVRQRNGSLIIEARQSLNNEKKPMITSGRIESKVHCMNCIIQFRAKVPKANGTWAAIWMLPATGDYSKYGNKGWPDNGEIDILETVGYLSGIQSVIHVQARNWMSYNSIKNYLTIDDYVYHTYEAVLDDNFISTSVDGVPLLHYRNDGQGWRTWPFDQEMRLIINLAIGGTYGGSNGVDKDALPQKLEVDYIRIFKKIP
ncbi:MAG: glycoside hydrolase family 16 protein [Bdellovibrio sp.]